MERIEVVITESGRQAKLPL